MSLLEIDPADLVMPPMAEPDLPAAVTFTADQVAAAVAAAVQAQASGSDPEEAAKAALSQ